MSKPPWAAPLLTALGGLAGCAAACVGFGVVVERNAFRLRRVHVPVLPAGHAPIRVLHISDLHLLASQRKKIAWVEELAACEPDFIVNTGDNIASPDALPALARALSPLSGIPGVFVFGSNDLHGPSPINPLKYLFPRKASSEGAPLPTAAMVQFLESCGWANAEQHRLVYHLKDSVLEIRGCGDAHIGLDDYAAVMDPPVDPALVQHTGLMGGTPPPGEDLLIAVTHAPYMRVLDQMADDGAGLILAGHTHGGQVCLPNGHALTTNCDLPCSQAKGLSTHGQAYLHVSAGLGTSPYAPYRFCCPPEASLLTLAPRIV